jgi:hypothetical protein
MTVFADMKVLLAEGERLQPEPENLESKGAGREQPYHVSFRFTGILNSRCHQLGKKTQILNAKCHQLGKKTRFRSAKV